MPLNFAFGTEAAGCGLDESEAQRVKRVPKCKATLRAATHFSAGSPDHGSLPAIEKVTTQWEECKQRKPIPGKLALGSAQRTCRNPSDCQA